jgi:hypothetical protein
MLSWDGGAGNFGNVVCRYDNICINKNSMSNGLIDYLYSGNFPTGN